MKFKKIMSILSLSGASQIGLAITDADIVSRVKDAIDHEVAFSFEKEKLVNINFSKQGLTSQHLKTLSSELKSRCKSLKIALNLSNNKLSCKTLLEILPGLPIYHLDLSNTGIASDKNLPTLAENLGKMPTLKSIWLVNNNLGKNFAYKNLDDMFIRGNICGINLSNNNLSFDAERWIERYLLGIKVIDLSKNKLDKANIERIYASAQRSPSCLAINFSGNLVKHKNYYKSSNTTQKVFEWGEVYQRFLSEK